MFQILQVLIRYKSYIINYFKESSKESSPFYHNSQLADSQGVSSSQVLNFLHEGGTPFSRSQILGAAQFYNNDEEAAAKAASLASFSNFHARFFNEEASSQSQSLGTEFNKITPLI